MTSERSSALLYVLLPLVIILGAMSVLRPKGQPATPDSKPDPTSIVDSVSIGGAGTGSASAQGPPKAELFFLVDASGSVHQRGGEQSAVQTAIPLLQQTVERWQRYPYYEQPTRIRVALIGDRTTDVKPLCEFILAPSPIFTPNQRSSAVDSARACGERLAKVAPHGHTDISGALTWAGFLLEGGAKPVAQRGIYLVTDLIEDLPTGADPSIPDLSGKCVVVALALGSNDPVRRNPSHLNNRRQEWTRKFAQWKAKGSQIWLADVANPDETGFFLRECAL